LTGRDVDAALSVVPRWGADHAAAAVVLPQGVVATVGDVDHPFRWASVTKLVTALAVLCAVDDGLVDLDEPAGPTGATVRHLLAHASGLPFEGREPIAAPATTRIYSNAGFDLLGELLADRRGGPIGHELARAVLDPLGMTATRLDGRPSEGLVGPLRDLAALGAELLRPTLLRATTFATAASVAFPGVRGILPGFGRHNPQDWGLGLELRDGKQPHWTGARNASSTFGHFGGTGTFLWVDPVADAALAVLTDRPFGPWAVDAWPALSDAVHEALVRLADGPKRPNPMNPSNPSNP
jgi:CubicO group peptidase (beta-lactamase class C family)